MLSDTLYQILLGVLIVAVIALIFVLIRLYMVLTDVNKASKIISEKVSKVGVLVDHIVDVCGAGRYVVPIFKRAFHRRKDNAQAVIFHKNHRADRIGIAAVVECVSLFVQVRFG